MRGRSKITFKHTTRYAFQGVDKQSEQAEITRLQMLNGIVAAHTVLGNKLKSIAKRMVTSERNKEDRKKQKDNEICNKQTALKYEQHDQ